MWVLHNEVFDMQFCWELYSSGSLRNEQVVVSGGHDTPDLLSVALSVVSLVSRLNWIELA